MAHMKNAQTVDTEGERFGNESWACNIRWEIFLYSYGRIY